MNYTPTAAGNGQGTSLCRSKQDVSSHKLMIEFKVSSVKSDLFSLNSSLVEIPFMTSTIGRYADIPPSLKNVVSQT